MGAAPKRWLRRPKALRCRPNCPNFPDLRPRPHPVRLDLEQFINAAHGFGRGRPELRPKVGDGMKG
jgi:hypothetical protein